jgi:hypothetical protein
MQVELAAVHEAGHSVLQWLVGWEPKGLQMTVVDASATNVVAECPCPGLESTSAVRKRLLVLFAGNAATREHWPASDNNWGDWQDVLKAIQLHFRRVSEDTEREGERPQSGGRESLPPETVFCTCCDAVSDTTLALALRAGWQCIVDDEGNERGNYAGMCPGCIEKEEHVGDPPQERGARETAAAQAGQQKTLF